jgi:ubiquinone/menaquinone biosynthesis C-methylase UbiE
MADALGNVAYCGFVCTACSEALPENAGCPGCRSGGGEADCRQRRCCEARGIDGCWQCEDFPCGEGFATDGHDPAFRSFWLASVRCLQQHGVERFASMVESRLGRTFDHAAFRGKGEEEIMRMLRGSREMEPPAARISFASNEKRATSNGLPQHPEPNTQHLSSRNDGGAHKMEWYEFFDISERFMEILNPTSAEKLLEVGQVMGLKEGDRIIDFGCGFGEMLVLWAEEFGIGGLGVDLREYAVERARAKMAERSLTDRIEIVQGNAAEYEFETGAFAAATCIGATFIWGDWRKSIRAMREAVRAGGRLAIGECYWLTDDVPPEYAQVQTAPTREHVLLESAREEGFDVEYVVRASHDDWARYESGNWRGLLAWLDENPDHPERQAVADRLHSDQDEHFRYARQYVGWAIYVLKPQAR